MSVREDSAMDAMLRLDEVQSNGKKGRPVDPTHARLMALSAESAGKWYGFVIEHTDHQVITPGSTVNAKVAFLDHEGAAQVFVPGSSFLFGDGVSSRGTMMIIR